MDSRVPPRKSVGVEDGDVVEENCFTAAASKDEDAVADSRSSVVTARSREKAW